MVAEIESFHAIWIPAIHAGMTAYFNRNEEPLLHSLVVSAGNPTVCDSNT